MAGQIGGTGRSSCSTGAAGQRRTTWSSPSRTELAVQSPGSDVLPPGYGMRKWNREKMETASSRQCHCKRRPQICSTRASHLTRIARSTRMTLSAPSIISPTTAAVRAPAFSKRCKSWSSFGPGTEMSQPTGSLGVAHQQSLLLGEVIVPVGHIGNALKVAVRPSRHHACSSRSQVPGSTGTSPNFNRAVTPLPRTIDRR